MSYGARVFSAGVRRNLIIQAAITVTLALAFLVLKTPADGIGALYGGGISLIIAALLGWRIQRASNINRSDDELGRASSAAQLYIGAAERFIVVGAGIGAGIALLKLPPVAVILGFAVAQMSFLFRVSTRLESTKKPGVT